MLYNKACLCKDASTNNNRSKGMGMVIKRVVLSVLLISNLNILSLKADNNSSSVVSENISDMDLIAELLKPNPLFYSAAQNSTSIRDFEDEFGYDENDEYDDIDINDIPPMKEMTLLEKIELTKFFLTNHVLKNKKTYATGLLVLCSAVGIGYIVTKKMADNKTQPVTA